MNKGHIKIALALLSVAGYMQNIVFANEFDAATISSNEESEHQISISPEEATQAAAVMVEALDVAKKHAEHTDDYGLYYKKDDEEFLHFKRANNTEIGKLEFTIHNPDSYSDIVNMLWDPSGGKDYDNLFIQGALHRIYNENLVIRQQRYKSVMWDKYYYALANKVELSEDETAIVLTSSQMNDHDPGYYAEYVNPLVESANSFKPEVDSEEDIRRGKLYKTYVNLMTLFIKKEVDCVKITVIASIDHSVLPDTTQNTIRKMTSKIMLNIINLRDIFEKK
ncbi:fam-a protein [Plasmodium chabaudi chabaudi]|uniref:Fam-a protein n=1 Tax=Plasmodium chabaudi chabaudi TaxID=31271 RepID=A0A1D3RRD6_PLACU|nr:fam-a protein [Plasmodium chabaudi chabaudi]